MADSPGIFISQSDRNIFTSNIVRGNASDGIQLTKTSCIMPAVCSSYNQLVGNMISSNGLMTQGWAVAIGQLDCSGNFGIGNVYNGNAFNGVFYGGAPASSYEDVSPKSIP